ncbi:MAG: hypothetical protein K1Y01_12615 [Vicinamibacteria bacterium]|nr:hypothetical protein [Vicinamibacteria bacterium]
MFPWIAGLAGLLMPGAGHVLVKSRGRAAVYFISILGLFCFGVLYGARLQFHVGFDDPLAVVRSTAQVVVGAPYFLARLLDLGQDPSLITRSTFEYGSTFTEVAGLLNILVALDAFDIAAGRKK